MQNTRMDQFKGWVKNCTPIKTGMEVVQTGADQRTMQPIMQIMIRFTRPVFFKIL